MPEICICDWCRKPVDMLDAKTGSGRNFRHTACEAACRETLALYAEAGVTWEEQNAFQRLTRRESEREKGAAFHEWLRRAAS